MSTSRKSLSASQTAVRFGVHQRTARLFMHKLREAMTSSGNPPITGVINVDQYVVGGSEESKPGRSYGSTKKKAVCELTFDAKLKRCF